MTIKGYKRYIAIALITAFAVTTLLPKQSPERVAFAKSLKNIKEGNAKIKYEKPETQTKLGDFSEELAVFTEKMNSSLDKEDLTQLKDSIREAEKQLKETREEIYNEFEENEKTLGKLNAKNAQETNKIFKDGIDKKLSDMEGSLLKLDELSNQTKDLKGEELAALKSKVSEVGKLLSPEQPQQSTGSLPHNNVNVQPPTPPTGSGITPAYVSQAENTVQGSLPRTPTPEDTEQIPETKLSEDIKAKADELGTTLKIYEYVQNNIDFEPYLGSRKGAQGTLHQMSGNDYDQASLLISMLRYKGIPSRYVRGTIELPVESVMNWTGGESPEAAVKILGALGIPVTSIVAGGKISTVQFEHVWAEAYIPYENYRGTGPSNGQKVWIPLDPSFKKYEKLQGINLEEVTGFTKEQIVEAFKTNGERSADGTTLTKVDIGQASAMADSVSEKVKAYITEKGLENANLKDIIGGRRIVTESLGLLPSTLSYKTLTVSSEFNKIAEEYSDKIGFTIKGEDPFNLNFSGDSDFNVSYRAVDLYGKRITLSWAPAGQEDVDIINAYGGLFNTPAYLIKIKPQLKIDGEVAAEGNAVGLGYRQAFTIVMGNAGAQSENITNPVTVGGYYNVALDYGRIDTSELKAIQNRLLEIKDRVTDKDIYTDEVMGDILNAAGKAYFGQLDAFNDIIGEATKVSSVRLISEAMTGYMPKVKYLFFTPVELVGGNFFIDVDHDVVGAVSYEDKKENTISYMMNAGVVGSAMEHGIFEQMLQAPSVSTIKVLTEASKRGIPIYTLNKSNADRINELTVSQSVKTDILNAVNSGKVVVIPKQEINYYDWHGAGYIIMDPDTGAAGYMISGGLAGGSAAVDIGVYTIGITSLIMAVCDTVQIGIALLSVTNPIVGVIFYALYAASIVSTITTIYNIEMYWKTGDYQYAIQLTNDLLLNLAFFTGFKVLEAMLPGITTLFNAVKNQMNDVSNAAGLYGDDVIEGIIRTSGTDIIQDADTVLKGLTDSGVNSLLINKVSLTQGLDGLSSLKHLLDNGKLTQEIADDLVTKGFNLYDVKSLVDRGIEVIDFSKYGITNGTEAKVIIDLMEKGYRLEDLARLVDYGWKPSAMISRGIVSSEIAKGVAVAGDEVFYTGYRHLDELDYWSEEAYEYIRSGSATSETALLKITENLKATGFTIDEIRQIMNHVFINEHDIFGVTMKFHPDECLAYMWLRSIQGNLTESEISFFKSLMAHELKESQLMAQGLPYRYLDSSMKGAHDLAGKIDEVCVEFNDTWQLGDLIEIVRNILD